MQNRMDTEPLRRIVATVLQWGGWLTNIALFVYATLEFDPNHGHFAPQWVGFGFIFSMGVGVAATLVKSRMRLSRSILGAFKEGRKSSRDDTDQRVAEVVKRQDELVVKLDAYVKASEVRADVAQRQQEILDQLAKINPAGKR
jgi:hypothetical protein